MDTKDISQNVIPFLKAVVGLLMIMASSAFPLFLVFSYPG